MPYSDPDKQRDFQKHYKRRTKNWFWDLKASVSCERCGIAHPAVIHFHHRKGEEKLGEVGRLVNSNLNREIIMAEIAKCDILCANCHAIWHYEHEHKGTRK
jgi:hypothetical protein